MKKLLLLCLIPLVLTSCVDDTNKKPEGYDYIVGDDYSDLVKVTFKYGNIEGKIGQTYKVWGVKRGSTTNGLEPKMPSTGYLSAMTSYGFTQDFKIKDGMSGIRLGNYAFNSDTTLYVKYYEPMQEIRFCIPNGPTNKGSGMMYQYKIIYGNTEIYRMPTLDNQTFDTDWGEFKLSQSLEPWVTQWGWTKIDSWFYDEQLTKPISTPFRLSHNGDQLKFWVKCS